MKVSFLFLVLLFGIQGFADNALVQKLQGEGFQCTTQNDGYICTVSHISNSSLHYSQPVAVVIPKNVTKPTSTQLYLHGFKGVCEAASTGAVGMVNEFHFLQQIKDTNSIMVFPMSSGQCSTYNGELVPQFSKFYDWMNQNVGPSDHFVLGGHSGAGRPMGQILAQNPGFTKKVDSTILLDATYGMGGHIGDWRRAVNTNHNMSIASVYTGGGDTRSGTQMLKSNIQGVKGGPASVGAHCQVPTADYGKLLKAGLQEHGQVVASVQPSSSSLADPAPVPLPRRAPVAARAAAAARPVPASWGPSLYEELLQSVMAIQ